MLKGGSDIQTSCHPSHLHLEAAISSSV